MFSKRKWRHLTYLLTNQRPAFNRKWYGPIKSRHSTGSDLLMDQSEAGIQPEVTFDLLMDQSEASIQPEVTYWPTYKYCAILVSRSVGHKYCAILRNIAQYCAILILHNIAQYWYCAILHNIAQYLWPTDLLIGIAQYLCNRWQRIPDVLQVLRNIAQCCATLYK